MALAAGGVSAGLLGNGLTISTPDLLLTLFMGAFTMEQDRLVAGEPATSRRRKSVF